MIFYFSNLAVLGISSFFLVACALEPKTEAGLQLESPPPPPPPPPPQIQPAQLPASHAGYIKKGSSISPARSIRWAPSATQLFKRAGQRWKDEEDDLLVELREEQSLSWSEIAEAFPERSWGALKQRYDGLMRDPLAPKGRRRGRIWTPEEDERLLELARTGISWEEMADSLPGRSPEAIEGHYYYKLLVRDKQAPTITRKRYTEEEDDILSEALEEGLSITEVSRLLKKSEQSVNRRIVKLKKLERFDPALSIKHRSYTVDELGLIHELREQGMTWKQIQSEHFPERPLTGIRRRYKRYQKEHDSREMEG